MSIREDGKGARLQTYMKLQTGEILRIAVGGMGRKPKDTTFIFTPGNINGESGGGGGGSSERDGGPGLVAEFYGFNPRATGGNLGNYGGSGGDRSTAFYGADGGGYRTDGTSGQYISKENSFGGQAYLSGSFGSVSKYMGGFGSPIGDARLDSRKPSNRIT